MNQPQSIHEATETVQRLQHSPIGWCATTTSWTLRFPNNFDLTRMTMQSRTGRLRVVPMHVYGNFRDPWFIDLHRDGRFTRVQFTAPQVGRMRTSMPGAFEANLENDLRPDQDYLELLSDYETYEDSDSADDADAPRLAFGIEQVGNIMWDMMMTGIGDVDLSDMVVQALMDATHQMQQATTSERILTGAEKSQLISKIAFRPTESDCPICCDAECKEKYECVKCHNAMCKSCVENIISTRQCIACPYCRDEISL